MFLAAASQRTKHIRLGHGIVQTPPPFNHPARVAERIAMLDLVSGGRADFGTGESSSEAELGGFMIEPEREARDVGGGAARRGAVHDRDAVHRSLRRVRHDAAAQRRARSRVQKPHPPLWVACSRRDTIHLAAQNGIGALAFAFVDPEEAQHWVDDYYTTLATEGVPIGDAVNANVACVTTFMCHDDEDDALARGLEGANFFGYSLAHYYVFGRHQPGGHRRVGRVPAARAPSTASTPKRWHGRGANDDRLGAKVVAGRASAGCAARSARPTRSASTCGATRSAASTR